MRYFIGLLPFILFVLVTPCHISSVHAEDRPPTPAANAEDKPQTFLNPPSPSTDHKGENRQFDVNTQGFKMKGAAVKDPTSPTGKYYAPSGSRAHIEDVIIRILLW